MEILKYPYLCIFILEFKWSLPIWERIFGLNLCISILEFKVRTI